MGTTATKLQAIINSKEAIRQAINAKGVTVGTSVPLADYDDKIALINEWTPPSDWIQLPAVANNEILILASDVLPTYNFKVNTYLNSGYTVDWGDGVIDNWGSGTECFHTYTVGTGQACSLGYTTFKIRVYSQNPSENITAFRVLNNGTYKLNYGWLWIKFGTVGLSWGYGIFYNYYYGNGSPMLECIEFPESLPNLDMINSILTNSYSLQKIIMPKSYRSTGISFNELGIGIPMLRKIDLNSSDMVIPSMYRAFWQTAIEEVKLPSIVRSCTDWSYAFYSTRLKSILIPNIDTQCTIAYMFYNSLVESISFPSSWNGKITKMHSAFRNMARLKKISLPSTVNIVGTDQFTTSLFYGCANLIEVTLPTNIGQSQQYPLNTVFYECNSLRTIYNFPDVSTAITLDRPFYNCKNLRKIYDVNGNEYDFSQFMDTTTGLDHAQTFVGCYSLNPTGGMKNRNKITGRFVLNGINANNRAALQRLIFTNPNPVSTWAGASPQIDISNCNFDAAALNELFTSIIATQDPAMTTGKTIRITGNSGANTCDTTILTAGGKWTVNKTT